MPFFTNFAVSQVSGGTVINSTTGTSLIVTGGDGAKFPTPPFSIVVWPLGAQATSSNAEVMRVTAVSVDTFTVTRSAEFGASLLGGINTSYQIEHGNTAGAMLGLAAIRGVAVTVGPTGSNADFICTGTNDDVTIQTAINSLPSSGQGTVLVREGVYVFGGTTALAFNGRKVRLIGDGIGRTVFTLSSSYTAGVMVSDTAATQGNIEVTGITWDMSGKANVGGMHIYQSDNLNVHHNEFTGQTSPVTSHWGVRLGHYSDSVDLSSRNVKFCNNYIHDMSCGTNEQLLFVGQRDAFVQDNVWRNNTNSQAYELTLYYDNRNVDVSRNIFEAPQANSICALESQNNNIHDNQFNYPATSFNAITNINSSGTKITDNFGQIGLAGNTATFVNIFDRALGSDGHNNLVSNSNDLTISNNEVDGFKYGVGAQLGGTVLGTAYAMAMTHMTVANNQFRNMLTGGVIRLGVDDVSNTMSNITVRGNNIYSWGGVGSTGAIFFTGYSTNIASMNNLFVYDNFVAPSSGGATVPSVRALGCTVADVSFNSFSGTGGLSLAVGAVCTICSDNSGINPTDLFVQGNITGATTFRRTNGDVITAIAINNVTPTIPAGQPSDMLTLIITQDATGGRTISKPTNVKLVGGAFSPTPTANAVDSWSFRCDGTNWLEVSRALNMS